MPRLYGHLGRTIALLCLLLVSSLAHAQSYAEIWKNLPWKSNVLTRDACQFHCEHGFTDSALNPYLRRCNEMSGTDGEKHVRCMRPHCQQICSYMGSETAARAPSPSPPAPAQRPATEQEITTCRRGSVNLSELRRNACRLEDSNPERCMRRVEGGPSPNLIIGFHVVHAELHVIGEAPPIVQSRLCT